MEKKKQHNLLKFTNESLHFRSFINEEKYLSYMSIYFHVHIYLYIYDIPIFQKKTSQVVLYLFAYFSYCR